MRGFMNRLVSQAWWDDTLPILARVALALFLLLIVVILVATIVVVTLTAIAFIVPIIWAMIKWLFIVPQQWILCQLSLCN